VLLLTGGAGSHAAAAAPARSARDEVKREFSKTVGWRAGQRVCVDHSLGSVNVRTHKEPEVRVRVDMRASADNRSDAEQYIQQIEIQVEETGSGICFRTKYPEQKYGRPGSWSFSAEYDLAVPETAPLDLRNRFGSVGIAGTRASAVVLNSHGSVRLADAAGNHRIENTFGSIHVSSNTGDVEVNGGNGSITIEQIQGSARARNRFGSIRVTGVKGSVTVRGDNGSVTVAGVGGMLSLVNSFGATEASDVGGAAEVQNSNGRILARNLRGGAVLRTSFGNIEAADITGNADITSTNGRVLLRNVTGAASITASFGQVDASQVQKGIRVMNGNGGILLADIGGDAAARTSFGYIRASRIGGSLQADNSNGSVQATEIKGGVSVRTTFGSVTMDGVGGAVDADNQNGSVTVAGIERRGGGCHPIVVRTSFSPIRLFLPDDAAYDVNARTWFGHIRSDFELTMAGGTQLGSGSVTSVAITSKLGAGGCEMRLTNQNGSIDIRRASGAGSDLQALRDKQKEKEKDQKKIWMQP
jgi:DUF4097 and DUF4098 domain-containing protein YvlB